MLNVHAMKWSMLIYSWKLMLSNGNVSPRTSFIKEGNGIIQHQSNSENNDNGRGVASKINF